MKKILFLIFLFPLALSAQLDLEKYRGKLNYVDLPIVEDVVGNPFLNSGPVVKNNRLRKLPSFRLSKQNFREPVGMLEAITASENYKKPSDITLNINPKDYGVYGGNSRYSSDASSKVKNEAYREATRGFYVADACPPFGICPRCAPYRIGRRY